MYPTAQQTTPPQSDWRRPSTYCRGINDTGEPCQRTPRFLIEAARRASREGETDDPAGKDNDDDERTDVRYYCQDHKPEAHAFIMMQAARLKQVNSLESLMERAHLHDQQSPSAQRSQRISNASQSQLINTTTSTEARKGASSSASALQQPNRRALLRSQEEFKRSFRYSSDITSTNLPNHTHDSTYPRTKYDPTKSNHSQAKPLFPETETPYRRRSQPQQYLQSPPSSGTPLNRIRLSFGDCDDFYYELVRHERCNDDSHHQSTDGRVGYISFDGDDGHYYDFQRHCRCCCCQSRTSPISSRSSPIAYHIRETQKSHQGSEVGGIGRDEEQEIARLNQAAAPTDNTTYGFPRQIQYLGELKYPIPNELPNHIKAKLRAVLAQPASTKNESGYIYMYWLERPQSRLAESARSMIEDMTRSSGSASGTRRDSGQYEYYETGLDGPSTNSNTRNQNKEKGKMQQQQQPEKMLVKIGRTKQAVKRRLGQWSNQCRNSPLLLRTYPYVRDEKEPSRPRGGMARKVPFHDRVEKLIHVELGDRRAVEQGSCGGCGSRHREWFEVDATREGLASLDEVVRRWVGWYEQFA